MITEIKLPSGHLGMYPTVRMGTDLTGEHHEMLLSAPETLFERTLASVIGSLLTFGDVYKLHLIDLMYLFFIVRSSSVGPTYTSQWKCRREVTPAKGEKQECGTSNTFVLNLSKIDTKFVPKGFAFPKHDVEADDIKTKVSVRFLTVSEEFDALDALQEENISKDQLRVPANAYKYAKHRLARALSFEDQRINDYDLEKREAFLKGTSLSLVNKLFADLKALDLFGPDLSARPVHCTKCKGESQLAIPFSGSFFLS